MRPARRRDLVLLKQEAQRVALLLALFVIAPATFAQQPDPQPESKVKPTAHVYAKEMRGYKVERVMNLTDVDDKTIRGCQAAGVPLAQFTQQFKDAFFADLETLRIKRADK